MARVLIATRTNDLHAKAVQRALAHKGHEAVLWYGADLPTRQEVTIAIHPDGHVRLDARGPDLERWGDFDTVWFRRPTRGMLPEDMHRGDRKIAERECDRFVHALWSLCGPDAFWVNPWQSQERAEAKPVQLREAAMAGLRIPPTLFTNDPARIRAFLRENPVETIYKPFTTSQWRLDDGVACLFTSTISEDDLPDDDVLRLSPGIFQPRIEKSHELRVTFLGHRPFTARLRSQEVADARLDWRASATDIPVEPASLPEPVTRACRMLMKRLGIVFGCFDFIVTPAGEHVFMEVNPMGQFLWVEQANPDFLLLDAFCELLIQRRCDFRWEPGPDGIRFRDVWNDARKPDYEAIDRRHIHCPYDRVAEDRQERPLVPAGTGTNQTKPGTSVPEELPPVARGTVAAAPGTARARIC